MKWQCHIITFVLRVVGTASAIRQDTQSCKWRAIMLYKRRLKNWFKNQGVIFLSNSTYFFLFSAIKLLVLMSINVLFMLFCLPPVYCVLLPAAAGKCSRLRLQLAFYDVTPVRVDAIATRCSSPFLGVLFLLPPLLFYQLPRTLSFDGLYVVAPGRNPSIAPPVLVCKLS